MGSGGEKSPDAKSDLEHPVILPIPLSRDDGTLLGLVGIRLVSNCACFVWRSAIQLHTDLIPVLD